MAAKTDSQDCLRLLLAAGGNPAAGDNVSTFSTSKTH
jgi:hypothetical protein